MIVVIGSKQLASCMNAINEKERKYINTLIYDTRTEQQPEASNIKKELVNTFGETSSIMNNTRRLIFEHTYMYF